MLIATKGNGYCNYYAQSWSRLWLIAKSINCITFHYKCPVMKQSENHQNDQWNNYAINKGRVLGNDYRHVR